MKQNKFAYKGGIILDGTKDMKPVSGMTVLVEEDRIADIVPDTDDLEGYEVIDLQGRYLLPGLINLHVHLATSGKPPKSDSKPIDYQKLYDLVTNSNLLQFGGRQLIAKYADMELMCGVTTFRTVGGVLDFDAKLRDEINSGKRTGPRIVAANTAISVPGGHFAGSIATEATSPEDAAEHVRQIAETNPDLIKLMITGGIVDSDEEGVPGILYMSPEIVKAACEEAHRLGYKVAAHVESPEGVRVALENGVDTIEHGADPDEETLRLYKERNAAFVCTLSPFVPYAEFDLSESHSDPASKVNGRIVLDGSVESAKKCIANDIPMGLGNDVGCPFVLHYNFWRELCYFHKYVGVSNAETLYYATLGNAQILGLENETGSIEKGKSADMIVVDGNPLDDLSVLKEINMVVMRGKRVHKTPIKKNKEVDQLLDKYM